MAEKNVKFTINIGGNALSGIGKLTDRVNALDTATCRVCDAMRKTGSIGVGFSGVVQSLQFVSGKLKSFTDASLAQVEAETKLGQAMRNTMGATKDQVRSILSLASAQQKLGVIGDEVQLSGAQELATYLSRKESLEKLLPVMNDMLAQQYGMNASQEQAVQIASMMGKVMDGQVGALSRYGYKFDKTQEKILKYGTEAQRVATLTDVISQSVGGMNRSLARTDMGKIKQLSNRLGDIKERMGGIATSMAARLVPASRKFLGFAERLLGVGEENIRQVSGEKAELNALVGSLIDVYGKEDDRKKLIEEIQRKYPDFLKNINLEKDGIEGLRAKLTEVNEEYDKRIRKAVLAHRLEKLQEESEEAYDDYLSVLMSRNARSRNEKLLKEMGLANDVDALAVKKDANGYYTVSRSMAKPGVNYQVQESKTYHPEITDELWNEYKANKKYILLRDNDRKLARKEANYNRITDEMKAMGSLAGADTDSASAGGGTAGTSDTQQLATAGADTIVTGGTRSTTVNISLGNMVESIVFNGSFKENAQELERSVTEIMYRVLSMAATI